MNNFDIRLAIYDQSWDAGNGVYWTWYDPELNINTLNDFFYDIAAKSRPAPTQELKENDIWGGLVYYKNEWIIVYRFYPGGKDAQNRPGRMVLLTGWIRKSDQPNLTLENTLFHPVFLKYAGEILPLPVSAPEKTIVSSAQTEKKDKRKIKSALKPDDFILKRSDYISHFIGSTTFGHSRHLAIRLTNNEKNMEFLPTNNDSYITAKEVSIPETAKKNIISDQKRITKKETEKSPATDTPLSKSTSYNSPEKKLHKSPEKKHHKRIKLFASIVILLLLATAGIHCYISHIEHCRIVACDKIENDKAKREKDKPVVPQKNDSDKDAKSYGKYGNPISKSSNNKPNGSVVDHDLVSRFIDKAKSLILDENNGMFSIFQRLRKDYLELENNCEKDMNAPLNLNNVYYGKFIDTHKSFIDKENELEKLFSERNSSPNRNEESSPTLSSPKPSVNSQKMPPNGNVESIPTLGGQKDIFKRDQDIFFNRIKKLGALESDFNYLKEKKDDTEFTRIFLDKYPFFKKNEENRSNDNEYKDTPNNPTSPEDKSDKEVTEENWFFRFLHWAKSLFSSKS